MLYINMEFRKGILFVRLDGVLSDKTCIKLDDNLEKMVSEVNIRFIVFNVQELKYIDLMGIKALLKYNNNLNRNGGKALICGIDNDLVKYRVENSTMLDYMFETSDELSAINVINM